MENTATKRERCTMLKSSRAQPFHKKKKRRRKIVSSRTFMAIDWGRNVLWPANNNMMKRAVPAMRNCRDRKHFDRTMICRRTYNWKLCLMGLLVRKECLRIYSWFCNWLQVSRVINSFVEYSLSYCQIELTDSNYDFIYS